MPGKKCLCHDNVGKPVRWFLEAVPFIRINHVGDRNIPGLHSGDDGIAFRHLAAHVIDAVKDQHGLRDILDSVDGRAFGEQLAAFLGARVAVAAIHVFCKPGPIGRQGLQQRLQIGDTDHGNGATENLRRECRAYERSQPAIRHAEDRDPVLLRYSLIDCPIDHVDQVVMHLAGVLFFARRDEGFAEPRRATVIDREHGIAPIGQPLMIAPIAEDITRPRTSMHDQYHRQRLGRAITFDVGRQRQI